MVNIRAVEEVGSLDEATLVVGALTGPEPIPGDEGWFEPEGLKSLGFTGKAGELLGLPGEEAKTLVVVGLGEEADFGSLRAAAGNAARAVRSERAVTRLNQVPIEGALRAVVEGFGLGSYRYRAYKTNEDQPRAEAVDLVGADQAEVDDVLVTVEATNLARDWVNTPAGDKSPEKLALMFAAAAEESGVAAEVWDAERIREESLGALLGVAAGSDRPPRVVVLSYRPDHPVGHLGLVGKGVTFDTGGLDIKPANLMEQMKDDMAGAAAVVAATTAIARLGMPLSVTVVTPLTDNALGGDATRPGDVLRPVSGPTIEVLNTDAEGRLILADGLGLVRRHDPGLIVDVATLTGASHVALGDKMGAVFASDPEVARTVLGAASRAGEDFWELPLFRAYRKALDSDLADIKNISGSRYGGAIHAALFLAEYAGDGPWAHLDIAGPARWLETSGEYVKGASGFGVRTLVELARVLIEADAAS